MPPPSLVIGFSDMAADIFNILRISASQIHADALLFPSTCASALEKDAQARAR
jgi:hypothetical protein